MRFEFEYRTVSEDRCETNGDYQLLENDALPFRIFIYPFLINIEKGKMNEKGYIVYVPGSNILNHGIRPSFCDVNTALGPGNLDQKTSPSK